MNFRQQLIFNLGQHPDYKPFSATPASPQDRVRLIAYYLPQFHPIPENDAWWGKGFTEWTNVTRAVPRYVGHYQPRLPGELGFYDLRLPTVLQQQAQLAKHYGIAGFCFHYYWFHGRRLLDTPIRNLLAHPEIDLPFCINWANENWARTWDGRGDEVLMQQAHSEEDDLAFAAALEPLLRDPRYIKVGSRPLIMVYRPALLPDAAATVRRWREYFTAAGLGNPYFVMAQCFGEDDPRRFEFDAAAEFPPHKVGWKHTNLAGTARCFASDFAGRIISYDQMVHSAVGVNQTDYTLFRGVCPSWDNEARKPNRGVSFAGATPAKYAEWLSWACRKMLETNAPDERLVFINAWNEWAEGAYLEPDRHYGCAYLEATAEALSALEMPPESRCSNLASPATGLPRSQMTRIAFAKSEVHRRFPLLDRLRRAWTT